MSNSSGFGSGFWLGTLVGGIVGGVIGATIANQTNNRLDDEIDNSSSSDEGGEKRPLKSRRLRNADRMEMARRSLDDKISDLNSAIDAVRSSIGNTPEDRINALITRVEGDISAQKPLESDR